jgi:hypothetical protein
MADVDIVQSIQSSPDKDIGGWSARTVIEVDADYCL